MSGCVYLMYHIIAFGSGFVLDLLLGDPAWLYHPVRLIGKLITVTERMLRGIKEPDERRELRQGRLLVLIVLLGTVAVTAGIVVGAYLLHGYLGIAVESILTWQALAAKSLCVESMRVYDCLKKDGLLAARQAVSMIVGRDTAQLDQVGVIRAAVETVAENTSDGVIAPMLYLCLGGPILGFAYKAVNTMDSMVGYKNEKYMYFGSAAAKLDDAVNFLPSRISGGMMLMVCLTDRTFDFRQALRIYRRDRRKHASPNSAQTEAVCAGALGLRLAGPASYFGKKVDKPYIGDEVRQIEPEDIRRANRLMIGAAWACEILCLMVLAGVWWILG